MISWVDSISGRPNIFIISPVLYGIGFATLVVLISGPFVSISNAMCCETARVFSTIFLFLLLVRGLYSYEQHSFLRRIIYVENQYRI